MSKFTDRIIRAAKLDPNLYEEVEADKTAMRQSMGVVILSSVAAGIGGASIHGAPNLFFGTIWTLIAWYVWAYITYFIGTKILKTPKTKSDHGELLRVLGFSSAPGILRILGIIPILAKPIFTVAGIWMIVAMVIAIRQALDYESTARAVGVVALGWLFQVAVLGLILFLASGAPA